MWTKARLYITVLLSAAFCLCWPCVGSCAEGAGPTYTITAAELETLEQHLNALETNNKTLSAILSESGEELTAALNALTQSQTELTKLKAELKACKAEAESARASLAIANRDLQIASESFKQSEAAHRRRENQLERQRLLWQIITVIIGGVAVAR
jgi:chromosome segregation ATPase